jgi:N-acyl-L-homoserine lactone synthetase
MTEPVGILDGLVARVLGTYPYRFVVAETTDERAIGYRIRGEVVRAAGWRSGLPEDQECDEYDESAVHIVGFDGADPVCTGRLVLPPGPLPTEQACGLVVEPAGRVVDVGRMAVLPSRQGVEHAVFVALLCRLYLEMRTRGYAVACGMMARRTRRLVRLLGLQLEELEADRDYWGEPRAPVRFELLANAGPISRRWE